MDDIEMRAEHADQTVSFDCPCGAEERVSLHYDSDEVECPECGAKYEAYTDTTVLLYRNGSLAGSH